jgi:hypothetical protein
LDCFDREEKVKVVGLLEKFVDLTIDREQFELEISGTPPKRGRKIDVPEAEQRVAEAVARLEHAMSAEFSEQRPLLRLAILMSKTGLSKEASVGGVGGGH